MRSIQCDCHYLVMTVLDVLAAGAACAGDAAPAPDAWIDRIRRDHPRLFFNADTWPAVKQRALTVNQEHFAKVREHAERPWEECNEDWARIPWPKARPGSSVEVRDWGNQLMSAALVYRVEPTPERLVKIRDMLQASVDYYHACYAANRGVHWYSNSRMGWLAAIDWVWDDLAAEERQALGRRMLEHVDKVLHKPDVKRRNRAGCRSGYYGGDSLAFFAGLVFLREGIDDARALMLLKTGRQEHHRMLAYRAQLAGDDGGSASPTLGYSICASARAEWNFFHVWRSATGEDISAEWPYPALLANLVYWNWLPGDHEFGYGDAGHGTNRMPTSWLYTHMSNIIHFYSPSHPQLAALAAYVRRQAGGGWPVEYFPIYALVAPDPAEPPAGAPPAGTPPARHFPHMGQVFMRSGNGDEDTYALFACGARVPVQYDATHFAIYKMGFLALDSGARKGNTDSLANYWGQTIAHNCILIKMPDEPPSPYWGGEVFLQAGGQNKRVGSKLPAFETCSEFTYVVGDATPVYSERKCRSMVRQFVFVPPDHFVVFDRVAATEAGYAKTWLLHHANEPVVDGKAWRSDQGAGRLFCRTLLPEDASLEKVGGPGREFLVEGTNYPITGGPSKAILKLGHNPKTLELKETPELMGRWRMEVKPGAPRTEDVFLHLIQVGARNLERMCESQAVRQGGEVRLTFAAGDRQVALRFAATDDVAGHIRIVRHGKAAVDREFSRAVMPQSSL